MLEEGTQVTEPDGPSIGHVTSAYRSPAGARFRVGTGAGRARARRRELRGPRRERVIPVTVVDPVFHDKPGMRCAPPGR